MAAAWVITGACATIWASLNVLHGVSGHGNLVATLLLGGAVLLGGNIELKFGHQEVGIYLDSLPLLLAAFFLPAPNVILIALVPAIWSCRTYPFQYGLFGLFALAYNASSMAIAMGTTVWVIHQWLVPGIHGSAVLFPEALAAALCFEIVHDVLFPVPGELYEPGSAREFLRRVKTPAAANVLLSSLGVTIISPYMHSPAKAIALLAFVQGAFYVGLRVANSEQLQRKRNQRLQDTFKRYVPSDLVSDNVEEMREVELGGEQRDISVLFCDIRGFTSWSEQHEASTIITELNSLLSELTQSVFSTRGTLDKFTGDGLMAFWGAPLPAEDHAERACRSALDMLQRLEALNERNRRDDRATFSVGIGVHSGSAVVGNVGHEDRLDYTAIGDTVNLAARLESATKELGSVLLISEATFAQLGPELGERGMRMGPVSVKGRSQSVEAYALQPLRPATADDGGDFALDDRYVA